MLRTAADRIAAMLTMLLPLLVLLPFLGGGIVLTWWLLKPKKK